MIDPHARAETAPAERQRQADDVIRIDQVVRESAKVELREDATNYIELQAFVRCRAAPSDQTETVAQADRRKRAALAFGIVERPEGAAQETHERPCFLRIRENRTEDLVLRECHRPESLRPVNACAAPRRREGLCATV